MNLALHGFLLQVFVSILDFRHGRLVCSAGEPGYLDFDNLPETNFSCQGKVIGGYYADVEAGCQMFHVCTIGQKDEIMDIKFLCLNGTVFDQETRVCERVDEVDCSKSERFYNLNLELYGNNAVTLSLHESGDDVDDLTIEPVEDHQLRTTSARPSTISTTSTTTSRPSKPSTTAASGSFQHPAGYPQHYQPQPPFPQVHTSQSKALYDDKNGGYHHQYIFHSGGERASNQATSYQLFSNQGPVSSTTVPSVPSPQPPPQIHQIRYSSTVGPPPQIIHSEPSTVTPLFHATSPTIQTLLNANNPAALINPIFHNHGIASTTEQFAVHSNNPRETADYRDDDQEQDIRALEAIQSAKKGKISKLTISPVSSQQEPAQTVQVKTSQTSQQQQQQRISGNFLPTPATVETTIRSFYPTPRPSPKPPSQSVTHQVTQYVHLSPNVPQLKPHQITINLPPPDIQRIVQNPSPLLPSQSRVIVTAKASVSDESGRPLNTTQLVTLPLPTIPASYDDYKEGDESFDPFYRDVPKIRKNRHDAIERISITRGKRSLEQPYHVVYGVDSHQDGDFKVSRKSEPCGNEDNTMNKESARARNNVEDYRALKESLIKFRDILFSDEANEDPSGNDAGKIGSNTERVEMDSETFNTTSVKQTVDDTTKKVDYLEDLKTDASKHLDLNKNTDESEEEEEEEDEDEETSHVDSSPNVKVNKSLDRDKQIESTSEFELYTESTTARPRKNESRGNVIDIIILDNDFKVIATSARTDAPVEIISEEETKSGMHDASKANEKVAQKGQARYLMKNESGKRSNPVADEEGRQRTVPRETSQRKRARDSEERKSGSRRKGSRTRSSRKRISSRIRQQRMQNVEMTEAIQQKEDTEGTTTVTSTTAIISIPTTTATTTIPTSTSISTTSTPTTTTTFTSTASTSTTVTPPVVSFKTEVAEQIDSNIFGESESRTFKEVDTRAIGQYDATYSKSLQDKTQDVSKNKELDRSFDHQIAKDHERNSDLHVDKKKTEQKTESVYVQSADKVDTIFTENPRNAEEAGTTETTRVSEEKISFNEGFSYKEYEFPDDDDVNTNEEEIEENSQDVPASTTSSDEVATSHEGNFEQEESSYRDDTSEENTDISDEEQSSTARSSEEVNSEESNEYQDITESSVEDTRSTQEDYRSTQEDYREPESTEGSTTLEDYTNSEEYTDSQEDVTVSTEETSTEGVLKFTDELPLSDEETTEEVSASEESDVHDYVDDNYEPENYKGMKSNESEEDKNEEKNEGEKKDTSARDSVRKSVETQRIDDSAEEETQTEYTAGVTEVKDLPEIVSLTTTASIATASTTTASTTMASTTMASTTTPTTTTSTTMASSTTSKTTTRRPITTTRATPPKVFKPTGNRRIYAYIPPTTTPVPVVIKPRLGLFNPKPAKPARSYNELAPKPMIRKLVLSRKPATTTVATTTIITTTTTEKLNTENPEMTTEPVTIITTMPVTMTTATMVATTTAATTTAATTTAATTTKATTTAATTTAATTTAATTTAATTTAATTTKATTTAATTTAATTTTASTTAATTKAATTTIATTMAPLTAAATKTEEATTTMTAESGRSEENGLESKLEANEHVSLDLPTNDQTNKEDQLSSPSEQDIPVNASSDAFSESSNADPGITTTEIETFTPYPLSRLSTLVSSIETTKETDIKPQETTKSTKDILMTTVPPMTLLTDKSDYEITPSTEKRHEITVSTTMASISKVHQQQTPSVSSIPPIPERATSVSILTTVLPKAEDADFVASMETAILSTSGRKSANPRKHASFNCLEKELYRFYGDSRDCRLFHYCSPGFTSRQVLDFRFVCEEGTAFDEVTQSCRHEVRNRKCRKRW